MLVFLRVFNSHAGGETLGTHVFDNGQRCKPESSARLGRSEDAHITLMAWALIASRRVCRIAVSYGKRGAVVRRGTVGSGSAAFGLTTFSGMTAALFAAKDAC